MNNKRNKKKKIKIIIMDIAKERSDEIVLEKIDPKLLLFDYNNDENTRKHPNEEINKFYNAKNTVSFASKVGRFQGFF